MPDLTREELERMTPEQRQELARSFIQQKPGLTRLQEATQRELRQGQVPKGLDVEAELGQGLAEAAQGAFLLARSLTDAVGLSNKAKTKVFRQNINKQRAEFRKKSAGEEGLVDLTRIGAEVYNPLTKGLGLAKYGIKAVGIGRQVGRGILQGATSGGLVAGLEEGDIRATPAGAAIGGTIGAGVGLLRAGIRPRDMSLKDFKKLTTRQSINKDPRSAGTIAAERRIRSFIDKFDDTRSVDEIMDDATNQMIKNAKTINASRYSFFDKATKGLGPQNFDDVVLDNQRLLNSIKMPGAGQTASSESRIVMKDFIQNDLSGKTVGEARQALVDISGQLNFKDDVVRSLWNSVKNSIKLKANNITISGKPGGEFLTTTDDIFQNLTKPAKEFGEKLLKSIEAGNFDEAVNTIGSAKNLKAWKVLNRHLNPETREALEGGILRSLLNRVEVLDEVDPIKYAKAIDKLVKGKKNPFTQILSKDSIQELKAVKAGAIALKRHPSVSFSNASINLWHRFILKLYDTRLGKAVLTKASKNQQALNGLVSRFAVSGTAGIVGEEITEDPSTDLTREDVEKLSPQERQDMLRQLTQGKK